MKYVSHAILALMLLVSCSSPTEFGSSLGRGQLTLTFLDGISANSFTKNPQHDRFTYAVQGTGPTGARVEATTASEHSITLSDLPVGPWSFSVRSITTNGVVLATATGRISIREEIPSVLPLSFDVPSVDTTSLQDTDVATGVESNAQNTVVVSGMKATKFDDDVLPLSMEYRGYHVNVRYKWYLDLQAASVGRFWVLSSNVNVGPHRVDAVVEDQFGTRVAQSTFSVTVETRGNSIQTAGWPADGLRLGVKGDVFFYDRRHDRLWVVDQTMFQVSSISLSNQRVEQSWFFDGRPGKIRLSADESLVYLAVQDREHSYTWWENEQSGSIAVFNAATAQKMGAFKIQIDPNDLAVLANGQIVVASGSGQWTSIHFYDGQTGALARKQSGFYYGGRLFADPNGHTVYYQDPLGQFSTLETVGDPSFTSGRWVRGLGRDAFCAGDSLFDASGAGFDMKSQSAFSLWRDDGTCFVDGAFLPSHSTTYLVTRSNQIVSYKPDFAPRGITVATLCQKPSSVFARDTDLFAVFSTSTGIEIVKVLSSQGVPASHR